MSGTPRSRARRRLLLIAAATLVAITLAELLATFGLARDGKFGGRPLPPYSAINTPRQRAWLERARAALADPAAARSQPGRFDVELGWTVAPARHGETRTNALGARGRREYSERAEPGVVRIACFGDSFTWGDGVGDAAAWPATLERTAPRCEAINFGVAGYGTDQALLRLRRRAPELGAHVLVLGVMLENIGRNVNRYRPLYYPQSGSAAAKPRFVLDGDALRLVRLPFADERALLDAIDDGSVLERLRDHEYWAARPAVPFGKTFTLLRLGAGWFAHRARQHDRLWRDTGSEPYRVTRAILTAYLDDAREIGANLAPILLFPAETDVAHLADGGDRYWLPLVEEIETRGGGAVLDLADALVARTREGHRLYRGGHLNDEGNRVVAGAVLAWLEARLGRSLR